LPFVLSFIANIARKRPELNRDKTISGTAGNKALDALNLRLANGEIDAKEYADRKKLMLG
jgi:uncharacterized membrane protein